MIRYRLFPFTTLFCATSKHKRDIIYKLDYHKLKTFTRLFFKKNYGSLVLEVNLANSMNTQTSKIEISNEEITPFYRQIKDFQVISSLVNLNI